MWNFLVLVVVSVGVFLYYKYTSERNKRLKNISLKMSEIVDSIDSIDVDSNSEENDDEEEDDVTELDPEQLVDTLSKALGDNNGE